MILTPLPRPAPPSLALLMALLTLLGCASPAPEPAQVHQQINAVPIRVLFEQGAGQSADEVRFVARPGLAEVRLMDASVEIFQVIPPVAGGREFRRGAREAGLRISQFSMELIGSRTDLSPEPAQWYQTTAARRVGGKFAPTIPVSDSVVYREVWPGIDLWLSGEKGALEYRFELAGDADSGDALWQFPEATSVSVGADGALVVRSAEGSLEFASPRFFELRNGSRSEITGGFSALGNGGVAFALESRTPGVPLEIVSRLQLPLVSTDPLPRPRRLTNRSSEVYFRERGTIAAAPGGLLYFADSALVGGRVDGEPVWGLGTVLRQYDFSDPQAPALNWVVHLAGAHVASLPEHISPRALVTNESGDRIALAARAGERGGLLAMFDDRGNLLAQRTILDHIPTDLGFHQPAGKPVGLVVVGTPENRYTNLATSGVPVTGGFENRYDADDVFLARYPANLGAPDFLGYVRQGPWPLLSPGPRLSSPVLGLEGESLLVGGSASGPDARQGAHASQVFAARIGSGGGEYLESWADAPAPWLSFHGIAPDAEGAVLAYSYSTTAWAGSGGYTVRGIEPGELTNARFEHARAGHVLGTGGFAVSDKGYTHIGGTDLAADENFVHVLDPDGEEVAAEWVLSKASHGNLRAVTVRETGCVYLLFGGRELSLGVVRMEAGPGDTFCASLPALESSGFVPGATGMAAREEQVEDASVGVGPVVGEAPGDAPVETEQVVGQLEVVESVEEGPVEEEPVEEVPVEEVPVEEVPVEEVPVEEVPVEEVPVEEVPVEEVPVEEIPVEEIPVEEIPVEEIPVEEIPVEEIPVEEIPVEEIPVEEIPVEEIPVEEIPVEEIPVEEIPVEEIPVEEIPVEEIPVEEVPVEEIPVEEAPVAEAPVEDGSMPAEALATEPDEEVDSDALPDIASPGLFVAEGALPETEQPGTQTAEEVAPGEVLEVDPAELEADGLEEVPGELAVADEDAEVDADEMEMAGDSDDSDEDSETADSGAIEGVAAETGISGEDAAPIEDADELTHEDVVEEALRPFHFEKLVAPTGPVSAGDELLYNLRIHNTGRESLSDVVITDALPTGVELINAPGCTGGASGAVLTCDIGEVPVGITDVSLSVRVIVDNTQICNGATATTEHGSITDAVCSEVVPTP